MAERENDDLGRVKFRARLSFEHLFKKSASIENGPEKYRANFIIDPKSAEGKKALAACEDAIDELVDVAWKGKTPKFKDDRYALMDGNDMVDRDGNVRDGYEDMMYVKGTNDKRVKLRDRDGQTEVREEDEKIYSGAYVLVYGRFYPITEQKKGGNGVFFTIDAVQFVKDGTKFEGGGIEDEAIENLGDDEDGDERPRRSRSRDDDDDRSSRRSSSRDEDRSSRRSSRDDDEDRPRKPKRTIDDDI